MGVFYLYQYFMNFLWLSDDEFGARQNITVNFEISSRTTWKKKEGRAKEGTKTLKHCGKSFIEKLTKNIYERLNALLVCMLGYTRQRAIDRTRRPLNTNTRDGVRLHSFVISCPGRSALCVLGCAESLELSTSFFHPPLCDIIRKLYFKNKGNLRLFLSCARQRSWEEIEASFSSSLLSVFFFISFFCCCCSSLWDLCEWGELGLAIGGNS